MAKKETTVEKALKPSNDLLKRLIKATGNEYGATADDILASDITEWTTTGCYLWNMQVSGDIYKGMPNGKVVGFAGPSGTMKTYACISVVDNFLKENPGGIVFIFDSENAITKDRLVSRGVTSGYVHLPVESLPDFKTQAFKLLKELNTEAPSKDKKYMIILDSLGNLPSAREIKNAEEGNTAADFTRPKDIRSIFRTLTVMLTKHQIPMLVTNHSYASVGAYGAPQVAAGGGGLQYAADIIVMFSKAQYKEKEERKGSIITSTLDKGRDTKEKTKIKMLLHYNQGLHKYFGLLDWFISAGMATKVGNKYEMNGGKYSEVEFYRDADTILKKEDLDKLNEFMKPFFLYGGEEKSHVTEPDADAEVENEKEGEE